LLPQRDMRAFCTLAEQTHNHVGCACTCFEPWGAGHAQVQYSNAGKDAYKGPVDCATRVYKKLGLRNGIYRGWLPVTLCRMSNYAYFGR
jgi:hypothetical protein